MQLAWDGTARSWRRLEHLQTEGDRFGNMRLGPAEPWDTEANAEFVIPGLADCHVHLTGNPSRIWRTGVPAAGDVEANLHAAATAGVTLVRDVGSFGGGWRKGVEQSRESLNSPDGGARFVSAGSHISSPGGHMSSTGLIASSSDELRQLAEMLCDGGASFVKVMNDPLVWTGSDLQPAVDAVRHKKKKVAVHAYTQAGLAAAVEGGAHTVEHLGHYSRAQLRRARAAGLTIVTTAIAAFDTVADTRGTLGDNHAVIADADAETFATWWGGVRSGLSVLLGAHQTDVICLGTDAGFPGTPFTSLPREMALLIALGLPPPDVLESATGRAAQVCGQPIGRLAEGFFADWVVYSSNPMLGERPFMDPAAVYIGGEVAHAT